jgi:hypothetical protein
LIHAGIFSTHVPSIVSTRHLILDLAAAAAAAEDEEGDQSQQLHSSCFLKR